MNKATHITSVTVSSTRSTNQTIYISSTEASQSSQSKRNYNHRNNNGGAVRGSALSGAAPQCVARLCHLFQYVTVLFLGSESIKKCMYIHFLISESVGCKLKIIAYGGRVRIFSVLLVGLKMSSFIPRSHTGQTGRLRSHFSHFSLSCATQLFSILWARQVAEKWALTYLLSHV